jgi:hypothetical protein
MLGPCASCDRSTASHTGACYRCREIEGHKRVREAVAEAEETSARTRVSMPWYVRVAVPELTEGRCFHPVSRDIIVCMACRASSPAIAEVIGDEPLPACPHYSACPEARAYWDERAPGSLQMALAGRQLLLDMSTALEVDKPATPANAEKQMMIRTLVRQLAATHAELVALKRTMLESDSD